MTNSITAKSKIVCGQYQTTDDQTLIRTDEEDIDDIEDRQWNKSSKLWSFISR